MWSNQETRKQVLIEIKSNPIGHRFKILREPSSNANTGGVTVTREKGFLAPVVLTMPIDLVNAKRLESDVQDDGFGFSQMRAAYALDELYKQGIEKAPIKPPGFTIPEKLVGGIIGLIITRP